jgi:hypothetical protein
MSASTSPIGSGLGTVASIVSGVAAVSLGGLRFTYTITGGAITRTANGLAVRFRAHADNPQLAALDQQFGLNDWEMTASGQFSLSSNPAAPTVFTAERTTPLPTGGSVRTRMTVKGVHENRKLTGTLSQTATSAGLEMTVTGTFEVALAYAGA